MDPFSRLGEFEIAHLVEFLEPIDIICLQGVSKSWRSVLNSDYISRVALLHHFPHVSQSQSLRDSHSSPDSKEPVTVDATLLWRRVVYRYHTGRMGQPTRMHQVMLDFTDSVLEWDVAEGYVAWISNERGDKVLRVRSIEGPDEGELREIQLLEDWLEYDEKDVTGELKVVTLKIVKGLVILSLEYPAGWNGYTHPPWSGNRAKFVVVDLKTTPPLLWKYRMGPQQTILGEVEWSEDKLYYLRRTPIQGFNSLDTADRSTVHFVIHDMFTGAITQEIVLENGNDLVSYKYLSYDVMVVDKPLKHFILVRDYDGNPWRMELMATIYSLTGKIVGKFLICPEKIVSPEGTIARNIFVDFTHRHDVFNITETFYCDFNARYLGPHIPPSREDEKFPPETIVFNSWCIHPQKKKGGFAIEQRQYNLPVTEREALSLKEMGETPKPASRFDILFSTLDTSIVCYDVDTMEIGIDVGVYEERKGSSPDSSGKLHFEQVARRKFSDKRLIDRIGDCAPLPLEERFDKALSLETGKVEGDKRCVENVRGEDRIARFVPGKGLLVRGFVHQGYWFCVEWCDRYLGFHTSWTPDDGGDYVSGILILDFYPPW